MAKNYVLQFGTGNPTSNTGLRPTFIAFNLVPGPGTTTPPGITEIPTSLGLYYFTYEPTSTLAFTIDGATTGLATAVRYISGSLDPIQAVDERITELGNTMIANFATLTAGITQSAVGLSAVSGAIGSLADSFGSTLIDPTTVFGFLKRLQEWNEGDSSFTKTAGQWQVVSRGTTHILGATTYAGSSTILANKTITDSGSIITKA